MRRGPRRAGLSALTALVLGLSLLQVHAATRFTYLEGDVPRDMLIYTQTSPDVTRVVSELTRLSEELTGGKGLEIWYDSGTSWPMQWYLRDFPHAHFFGTSLSGPPNDAPVLLVANQYRGGVEEYMAGYTAQEYVLRWWYPEDETYRNFAIAPELDPGRSAWRNAQDPHGIVDIVRSIADSVEGQFTPEGQQELYRLLIYRDLPAKNGEYNFTLYVRNDLVPFFNGIRY